MFSKKVNQRRCVLFFTTQELNFSNAEKVNIFSNKGVLHNTGGSQVLCHYL